MLDSAAFDLSVCGWKQQSEGLGDLTFLAFAGNSIQLVPDGTLLLHIVVLLAMVGVLGRTLYRPLNRVLEERERLTSGRLSEAKQLLVSAETKLSAYERALRDARAVAYKALEVERARALREHEQRVVTLREEIMTTVTEQKDSIRGQTEQARRTLAVEALSNAAQIGSRILGRSVRSPDSSI